MSTIRIDVHAAAQQLDALVDAVLGGIRVIITQDGEPIAELVPFQQLRHPASARGLVTIQDDFDEPLQDFRDYM
ncbi:MAG TPA: hypothetical protein VGX50_20435 [Longimicrobium sp.]|nr:hypothetical protein [Longimicrobium sp.]